jgi:peroxiredoxin Q/BCP
MEYVGLGQVTDHTRPLVGLAGPQHQVADRYRQKASLLKLGRLPAQLVVARAGQGRYRRHGYNRADVPTDAEMLTILAALNSELA